MFETEEEKEQALNILKKRNGAKPVYLKLVCFINELLKGKAVSDMNFLIEAAKLMFKIKMKDLKKFMLEKALINICYKNFNRELFNLLEVQINKQKKKFTVQQKFKEPLDGDLEELIEFSNLYCPFCVLKLKFIGTPINDLTHFKKFCDKKFYDKLEYLEKQNEHDFLINFTQVYCSLKQEDTSKAETLAHIPPSTIYDPERYFSLTHFYYLISKFYETKLFPLTLLTSFANNFEKEMKRCVDLVLEKKYTDAKGYLKGLKTTELFKEYKELRLHIYDLFILCHLECAEYFECAYYINLALETALIYKLKIVYFYFMNLQLAIERIGGIEGPSSCYKFGFESFKLEKLDFSKLVCFDQTTLNRQLRDCKLKTQIALSEIKDNVRELRNLETKRQINIERLFYNQKIASKDYTILSLYIIDGILYINLFYTIFKTEINFGDILNKFNSILTISKDILKRNVESMKDKADWWLDRLTLESQLSKLLKEIKIDIELNNKHIILILDEKSTNFPWEHTAFLKDKHVYRLPSLEYLEYKEINKQVEGISWIVDPDNNLENTRKRILNYFSVKKLNKNEENFDVLLYFGHGGGSRHLKNIKNKILFLFGCCSSKILSVSNFKRNGKALKHLEEGNTVIGCLWEVTDKDLDLISMRIIDNLFEGKCIACIIKEAIGTAKLQYLNGCSLVVYGLPTVLQNNEP